MMESLNRKTSCAPLLAAGEQLQLGELLGYGAKKDYKPMYQQLDEIEKKTAGGKSGLGWFDNIKQQVAAWAERRRGSAG